MKNCPEEEKKHAHPQCTPAAQANVDFFQMVKLFNIIGLIRANSGIILANTAAGVPNQNQTKNFILSLKKST